MPEKYRRPHHHERVQTVERMKLAWAAEREALLVIRQFNAVLSANGAVWFWPTIWHNLSFVVSETADRARLVKAAS